jgi:hypothetical protein
MLRVTSLRFSLPNRLLDKHESVRGTCLSYTYRPAGGHPTKCPYPIVTDGVFRDNSGERHVVNACEHRIYMLERFGS